MAPRASAWPRPNAGATPASLAEGAIVDARSLRVPGKATARGRFPDRVIGVGRGGRAGRSAAARAHRPAARPGHGADGARPQPRLLRRGRLQPARRERSRAVPDALAHPFLRSGVRAPRGHLGVPPRDARKDDRPAEPFPPHPRAVARAAGSDLGAVRPDLQPASGPDRPAGDLGDRLRARADDAARARPPAPVRRRRCHRAAARTGSTPLASMARRAGRRRDAGLRPAARHRSLWRSRTLGGARQPPRHGALLISTPRSTRRPPSISP